MSFTQPIKRIHFQHTHALRNLWTTLPVLLREIITIIFIYMYVHTYIHQMNESKIVLSIYVSKKDLPFIREIAGFKELLLCVWSCDYCLYHPQHEVPILESARCYFSRRDLFHIELHLYYLLLQDILVIEEFY